MIGNEEILVDGMEIAPDSDVRIWIEDPSGINVSSGIGHRLLVHFDTGKSPVDVTSEFAHWSSATRGFVDVEVPGERRTVEIRVDAWDNWNNFASDSLLLRVGRQEGLTLSNVIAYPNPMADRTTFTWVTGGLGSSDADATIRVYTVAGRLVDTITSTGLREGPAMVSWRPDRELANGVYLYQISVRRTSDGRVRRAVEKLAVIGR